MFVKNLKIERERWIREITGDSFVEYFALSFETGHFTLKNVFLFVEFSCEIFNGIFKC